MCALLVSSVSVVHNVVRQCMSKTCLEWTVAYPSCDAAMGADAASLGMMLNHGAKFAALKTLNCIECLDAE